MVDTLALPLHDVVGQRAQRRRAPAEHREPALRLFDQPPRLTARRLDAVQRRVGRLLLALVAAGGLAQYLQATLDVEDVVHDLEREAQALARVADRRDRRAVAAGQPHAGAQRAADERRRLVDVDVLERLGRDRLALRLDIHHLAADHAPGARGVGDL